MFNFFTKRRTLAEAQQDALNAAKMRRFELELERDAIDGALEGLQMRIDRLEHELKQELQVLALAVD